MNIMCLMIRGIDKPTYTKNQTHGVERILDNKVSKSTRGKDYMDYLVQW